MAKPGKKGRRCPGSNCGGPPRRERRAVCFGAGAATRANSVGLCPRGSFTRRISVRLALY